MNHPVRIVVSVRYVVAAARVAPELPVDELFAKIPRARLDARPARLLIRVSSPKAGVYAFSSGRVVMKGLRDVDTVGPAHAALIEMFRSAGANLAEPLPAVKVVNVVVSGTFEDGISLIRLAGSRNLERIEYDPEKFSGLVYRSRAGPAVLAFPTGSLIATGVRSLSHAQEAAIEVWHSIDAAGAWQRRR